MSWNIGANDVANAMGTSVGSKALSFKKAIMVAAIFEFAGAFLVGGHVTNTIRSKIIEIGVLDIDHLMLIRGMLAALIGSAVWIHIATFFGWPVSTSHSIVGGVMGFGLYVGGIEAIKWVQVAKIAASWVLSPLVGALLGAMIFIFIRNKMLDSKTPLKNLIKYAPYMLFSISLVLFLALFFKGLKNLQIKLTILEALGISALISIVLAAISMRFLTLFVLRKIKNRDLLEDSKQYGKQYQIIEETFKYLQIITACFMAFAHGSNDVANATGPVAAIVSAFQTETIAQQIAVPTWVLGIGAVGIVIGLFTYGYKVIRTIGQKITQITPTRGFSAEFGAAFTILIGSKLGLPISTTHTVVGAIVGIGFARGIAAINKNVLKSIFSSWFITLPAAGIFSIISFLALGALF
jgi:PiT family inorganic phosphate transporter